MENNDLENRKSEELDPKQNLFDFDNQMKQKSILDEFEARKEQRKFESLQQQAEFNFAEKQRNQEFDFDMKQRDASIRREDEDLAFQRKRQAMFDQDELDARKGQRETERLLEMAEREHLRRKEELEQKGNIAMRNMQMMMESKRAAKQDELQHEKTMQQAKLDAEERRMQTQKEMTAEQIMAAQIREMDAGAQAKFAESFSAGKNAERERDVAQEKVAIYEQMMKQMQTGNTQNAQMQQQMMQQMMEMAKMGFQANANVASGRIDALRENMNPTQPIPSNEPVAAQQNSVPLNTAWLRQHGYHGSFNELAGLFANMGGDILQNFDDQGNPVIVVTGLGESQIMDVLIKQGVEF